MTFYETLDSIMKQDFGGRGLLASLPASPLAAVSASLAHAKRAVLLTGFPVRMPDGSITGGKRIRDKGIRVESLAIVDSMNAETGEIVFRNEDK